MANLKRNTITLVKDVKEGEVITETYITPTFVPLRIAYEATDVSEYISSEKLNDRERYTKMIEFVTALYKEQFTIQELTDGLHGPEAIDTLREQLLFAANGIQDEASKKFLAKKR